MTNDELIVFAETFRQTVLGEQAPPEGVSFAITAALARLLNRDGVEASLSSPPNVSDSAASFDKHFWIILGDGSGS